MNMPTVKEIIQVLDGIAPFHLAEKWDNSGLQAGHPDWSAAKILVALDVTREVMAAAAAADCSMVVCHHPLMMTPEKSLDFSGMPGQVVYASAREKISIVSAHTNLDKARDGLNDYFAQKIGVCCNGPFYLDRDSAESEPIGIGRVGRVNASLTVEELAAQIKTQLGVPFVRVVGHTARRVATAALCTGSGGSLTNHFLKSDADVYITGDLKYHEARDIEAAGRSCIDVGHFASEHIVVDMLTRRLEEECRLREFQVDILGYNREKDPFRTI